MILAIALSGIALLAQAPPTAPRIPCNRLVKVIATGSLAERKAMAATVRAPAEELVAACPELLRRGFGSPLRGHLPTPGIETWKVENQWLAAYLLKTAPRDAAFWSGILDVSAIPPKTLLGLIEHWSAGTTIATGAIFNILGRMPAPEFRNEVLHRLEPNLTRLEATDVTTATLLQADLERLGFGYLITDSFRSTLWNLRLEIAPVEVTAAEVFLAQGELVKAFRKYAAAAKKDERYLILTALVAEEILRQERLKATELIPLGIEYQKCGEIYIVSWKFGALYRIGGRLADPEMRAVMTERSSSKCAEDFLERLESSREALTRFSQTKIARRFRLLELGIEADNADVLSRQGRSIQGNELRESIWREVYRPESYLFLGGPTRARQLKNRVGQFLAFPPEPEVHVNENDHLIRNKFGEIVHDGKVEDEGEDVPYVP